MSLSKISTPLNIMAAFSHLLCYYQSQNRTKMASVMRACLSLFTDEPTMVNRTFRELEDRDVTQFALHAFQQVSVFVEIQRTARVSCKH